MTIVELIREMKSDVRAILTPDFQVEVAETLDVPDVTDTMITFPNIDEQRIRCKTVETCVLFIDIRNSASMSVEKRPHTLARIYSAFVHLMVMAAQHFDGHVRDIIGDRIMVVFDTDRCFQNAVDTAILMNTLSTYVMKPAVNQLVKDLEFRCGIGVDFGKMMVTKAGVAKRGDENEFYRSFVWLGKPANIASRLTDVANKALSSQQKGVRVGLHYPYSNTWYWEDQSFESFVENIDPTYSRMLRHKDDYFNTFFMTSLPMQHVAFPPILISAAVYDGLKAENPECDSLKKSLWSRQSHDISEYDGTVYGGNIVFVAGQQL